MNYKQIWNVEDPMPINDKHYTLEEAYQYPIYGALKHISLHVTPTPKKSPKPHLIKNLPKLNQWKMFQVDPIQNWVLSSIYGIFYWIRLINSCRPSRSLHLRSYPFVWHISTLFLPSNHDKTNLYFYLILSYQ